MRKILILGGYGQFGRHIVERLSVIPEIEILVAGRDIKKANALIQQLTEVAKSKLVNSQLSAVSLDLHTEKLSDFFIHTKPFICVNTVGPFQDQDFSIARQCIEHGVSYIDLADARRYVTQFSTLDALARSRNVIAVTGASSVPALSAAIVDACSEQIAHIDSIVYCISPGNKTDRGEATVAAIMRYVGQRIDIWHDGHWQQAIGWQSTKKQRWSEGMSERWVSICDIPDLSLFPQRYPSAKSVVFRAGLELPILHWGTWVLSWLTRLNLVRNWARFASTLTKVSRWFMRFGTDTGGMHMRVTGKNPSGEPITLTFELVAHHNDGPKIPALAAVILCKKWLQAEALIAGASPCVGHISLSEFIVEAQDLSIRFFGPKT